MVSVVSAALWCVIVYVVYKLLDWFIRLPCISHLDQRYYFITGCDIGFGNGIAKKLDKLGCHVFAACLTEKGETELKKSCSDRLVTVPLDVSNHDNVVKAFNFVESRLPNGKGLDGLLNNAGISGFGIAPLEWNTLDDYKKVIAVNLLGLIDVTTVFLPLVKNVHGRVVNTSSVSGRISFSGFAPYSITKYGVEAFSDALRREMEHFKVSVHIVEPGAFLTNIWNCDTLMKKMTDCWNQTSESVHKQYGQAFFDASIEWINFARDNITPDISGVVNAYTHALTSCFPRARYEVGWDCKFYLFLQTLPEWMADWIIKRLKTTTGAIPPVGLKD